MTEAPTRREAPLAAPVPLREPREGVPRPVTTEAGLRAVIDSFTAASGPLAVDAERASGFRYGQRAYLVQIRREGAGTALLDPTSLPDLSALGSALRGAEWVLHAASQDLPCLRLLGLVPVHLFDTELAGRLLGYPRVGLGSIVETVLGFSLEKGHSAADWSTRPLPEPWLRYAALDVELLIPLRDALEAQLRATGKLGWAREEFEAVLAAPPAAPRNEPWRRTSGLHRVRRRRPLAVVRELWYARDQIARSRDLSPGRVLQDSAIVEAALATPRTLEALAALPGFGGRGARRQLSTWFAAVARAAELPEQDLPAPTAAAEGPPPARAWSDRDPAAAARLAAARAALLDLASRLDLPVENLLAPDALRRIAWDPPDPLVAPSIGETLAALGARRWQVDLTAPVLAAAFAPQATTAGPAAPQAAPAAPQATPAAPQATPAAPQATPAGRTMEVPDGGGGSTPTELPRVVTDE